jgi:beta-amylase
MESLKKAAEERGHPEWATGPNNAGEYNSKPQDTGFFRDGGDYDSYYGRFFLNWYSKVLIEHGDQVLRLANLAFEGVKIAAKVSTVALKNTHLVVDICIPYDLLKLRCETILAHH